MAGLIQSPYTWYPEWRSTTFNQGEKVQLYSTINIKKQEATIIDIPIKRFNYYTIRYTVSEDYDQVPENYLTSLNLSPLPSINSKVVHHSTSGSRMMLRQRYTFTTKWQKLNKGTCLLMTKVTTHSTPKFHRYRTRPRRLQATMSRMDHITKIDNHPSIWRSKSIPCPSSSFNKIFKHGRLEL